MSVKVLVTSISLGKVVREPVELLNSKGYEIIWNKLGRPLKEKEVRKRIKGIVYFFHWTTSLLLLIWEPTLTSQL